MPTYKVTIVVKVENEEDIGYIVPCIEEGMEFNAFEGIEVIEIKECEDDKKTTD